MNTEFKITYDYRPCIVSMGSDEKIKAIFHCWDSYSGSGIVEFEDGKCGTYNAWQIQFTKPILSDYIF